MKALIDGDIIRYEVAAAAETGWKQLTETDDVPPWDFVQESLDYKMQLIMDGAEADDMIVYLSGKGNFRNDIAVTKPYKGNRKDEKPWHFHNMTSVLLATYPCEVVNGMEADDAMGIAATADPEGTIICTRDKDLRQVNGNFFSWELGNVPQYGPVRITYPGWIALNDARSKCKGDGYFFFLSQLITGDVTDNIPGLRKGGPVLAYNALSSVLHSGDTDWGYRGLAVVEDLYKDRYGEDWEVHMEEQGKLLWICRRLNSDGTPETWKLGMVE